MDTSIQNGHLYLVGHLITVYSKMVTDISFIRCTSLKRWIRLHNYFYLTIDKWTPLYKMGTFTKVGYLITDTKTTSLKWSPCKWTPSLIWTPHVPRVFSFLPLEQERAWERKWPNLSQYAYHENCCKRLGIIMRYF